MSRLAKSYQVIKIKSTSKASITLPDDWLFISKNLGD
jgi:hypothetical protein